MHGFSLFRPQFPRLDVAITTQEDIDNDDDQILDESDLGVLHVVFYEGPEQNIDHQQLLEMFTIERARWVGEAKKFGVPIDGFVSKGPLPVAPKKEAAEASAATPVKPELTGIAHAITWRISIIDEILDSVRKLRPIDVSSAWFPENPFTTN